MFAKKETVLYRVCAAQVNADYIENLGVELTELDLEAGPRPKKPLSLKRYYRQMLGKDLDYTWRLLPRLLPQKIPGGNYTGPFAKMLAVLQCTLRGTPIIVQGEELGFTDDTDSFNLKEVDKQELDAVSVLSFYRDLIALRNRATALMQGGIRFTHPWAYGLLSYTRAEDYYIEANLRQKARPSRAPPAALLQLSNYGTGTGRLRPYEARIYKM